jgi:hypothetical protein
MRIGGLVLLLALPACCILLPLLTAGTLAGMGGWFADGPGLAFRRRRRWHCRRHVVALEKAIGVGPNDWAKASGKQRMIRAATYETISALGLVIRQPPYRLLALAIFAPVLALYLFMLPSAFTAGTIGLVSLQYLNTELAIFSVLLAGLLSLSLVLNIYTFRSSARRKGSVLTVGALASSLLPSTLCCTPVVPTILAFVGVSASQIFGMSGRAQGFIATYETAFLGIASILLLLSLRLTARTVMGFCPLPTLKPQTDGVRSRLDLPKYCQPNFGCFARCSF